MNDNDSNETTTTTPSEASPRCPTCAVMMREAADALAENAELRRDCAQLHKSLAAYGESAVLVLRRAAKKLEQQANPSLANIDAHPKAWAERIHQDHRGRAEHRQQVARRRNGVRVANQ